MSRVAQKMTLISIRFVDKIPFCSLYLRFELLGYRITGGFFLLHSGVSSEECPGAFSKAVLQNIAPIV